MIQELLVEILNKFRDDENFSLKTKTKSWDLFNFTSSDLNFKIDTDSSETLSLKYLIDTFNRVKNIQHQQKVTESNKNLFAYIVDESIFQIVNNAIILLNGGYSLNKNL